jgi:hypothetical protein
VASPSLWDRCEESTRRVYTPHLLIDASAYEMVVAEPNPQGASECFESLTEEQ